MRLLSRLKNSIPNGWVLLYHRFLAWFAAAYYGHPSRQLIVIGVTGTAGKTTTSYLIAKALEASGYPTGCTTTALFKLGEKEWINTTKMTMLGRFQLQKMLRDMVTLGCRYAVIETSSQGVLQFRHAVIAYDVAVLTNLTPEHIEAHGGFENYKRAKQELFRHTAATPQKHLFGHTIPKIAVLNAEDPHAQDFAFPGFDRVVWYSTHDDAVVQDEFIRATQIQIEANRSLFNIQGVSFRLALPGRVNVQNATAAAAVSLALGLPLEGAAEKLAAVTSMPGRLERVDEGQPWTVLVDYAHEPESLQRLYDYVEAIPHARIIQVIGSAGGGRDVARRSVLGKIAGERADLVIVTNEDPYDDDPLLIMTQVAEGVRETNKKEGETFFIVPDRREAILQAMRFAKQNDVVLLTGKGSEQVICAADGQKIPWDDREVAREALTPLHF